MQHAEVGMLDGKTVMALLLGTVRAECFCDGALLGFCKDGSVIKWLGRLKELDQGWDDGSSLSIVATQLKPQVEAMGRYVKTHII